MVVGWAWEWEGLTSLLIVVSLIAEWHAVRPSMAGTLTTTKGPMAKGRGNTGNNNNNNRGRMDSKGSTDSRVNKGLMWDKVQIIITRDR